MSTSRNVMTKNSGLNRFNIEYFDSADEVVATCKTRKITDGNFNDMQNYAIKKSWHGVDSYEEALELMRTGYQPTVDSMKGVFSARIAGESKRFSFQNSIQGFAPIVPLALRGVPNSMLDMRMKPIKSKVIDVYYNAVVSSYVTPAQLIEAGQKLLGAIVELEQQGYRFNLYAVQAYCDSNSCDMMVVKMKDASKPLDIKRVSFPLTHPGFFRVIGFDWYSKCPNARYRSAYGTPITIKLTGENLRTVTKELFGNSSIMFNAQSIVNQDKEGIKECISNAECKDR